MTTFINNFYVLHKTVHNEPLDANLIVGYATSVSNFCQTVFSEELREVISMHDRIVFKEVEEFIFLVHAPLSTNPSIVQALLRDVADMFEFLFGSPDTWNEDFLNIPGINDIIRCYVQKILLEPGTIVAGIRQIPIDSDVSERLDKLLAFVESVEGVCGNGTMLLLGNSVLHSRFPLKEGRLILHYCQARPLNSVHLRFTPIFCNGAWQNIYFIRLLNYVLVVMTLIDKPISSLQAKYEDFRNAFIQSRLEIPVEEPSVLMRMFAKRETLALMYHNIKTGIVVFPQLRPGPDVQQKEILTQFWWFYSEAISTHSPGLIEYSIVKDHYRFEARLEGIHHLYVLFASDLATSETVSGLTSDILKNLILQYDKKN